MPEAHAVVPATITEDSARRHAIQALSNMGTVDEATVTMTGITEVDIAGSTVDCFRFSAQVQPA